MQKERSQIFNKKEQTDKINTNINKITEQYIQKKQLLMILLAENIKIYRLKRYYFIIFSIVSNSQQSQNTQPNFIMNFEAIKQMQQKRDWATFNIRKVQRKGQIRQPQELGLYTPEYDFDKYPDIATYTNPKKQKQIMIDYSVNQAILNSKTYCDLKQMYNENKVKNQEIKKNLQQVQQFQQKEIERLKQEKIEALEQEQRLQSERRKYQELMNGLKERIIGVRQKNRQTRQYIQLNMNSEAQYLSNILLSMRFQAEYQHDINPDQMTYEELLELQQKIGCVCKGLPVQILEKLPEKTLQVKLEDQCTICFCQMEKGEVILLLPSCQHKFHKDCLRQWLAKQKICPLCKRQISIQ